MRSPTPCSAPVGQASTSSSLRPLTTGLSSSSSVQRPQLMQRWRRRTNSGDGDWLSGLWHHAQLSGQPFMKTVVRTPGPSWSENRCTLKTRPVCITSPGGRPAK